MLRSLPVDPVPGALPVPKEAIAGTAQLGKLPFYHASCNLKKRPTSCLAASNRNPQDHVRLRDGPAEFLVVLKLRHLACW